jgi:hypothetical protein
MRKFYYEYDEVEGTWDVYEEDGGKESGGFYDVLAFCCDTEDDAIDAVDLLHELQEQ